MKFHCKKLTDQETGKEYIVSREDCDYFGECKKDGYLDEVDRTLNISPGDRQRLILQRLVKRCQRALDPMRIDYEKKSYSLDILGGIPFRFQNEIDEVPTTLSVEQLNPILEALQVPATEELIREIKQATLNYSSRRALWKQKPPYGEIKELLKEIHRLSDELARSLDKFFELTSRSHGVRTELCRTLETDGHDLLKLTEGIVSLCNAAHEVIPKVQKDLPNMPFYFLVEELKRIFEDATSQAAEVSPNTRFLKFVHTFLEVVAPDAIR